MTTPKPRARDLTKCATRVWGAQEGTARWQGYNQCRSPLAFKSIRADGSTIACYCKRHAPKDGQCGLTIRPVA